MSTENIRTTAFASESMLNMNRYPQPRRTSKYERRESRYEKRRNRLSSFAIIHNMKVFGVPKKGELNKRTRHRIYFSSGSNYEGEWDQLGLSGDGDYNFPHGVNYKGCFYDGLFDGMGTLTYPGGQVYTDWWPMAKGNTCQYQFADGLVYTEPWMYCRMPDRRFQVTIINNFRPGGHEYLTNDEVAREIPTGCYDVGDGFFDPKLKVVFSPSDRQKILRIPTPSEEHWIIKHCRKAWDEPTKYRPDLYEKWVSGRESEDDQYPVYFESDEYQFTDSPSPSDEITVII